MAKINLEYIREYETNFIINEKDKTVDYKYNYNETSRIVCTFYTIDNAMEYIEHLENNIDPSWTYKKASKAKKTMYVKFLEELNRISFEYMGLLKSVERDGQESVGAITHAYKVLTYRNSPFSEALDYIRNLKSMQ